MAKPWEKHGVKQALKPWEKHNQESDEPGVGSKILDGTLRALDYTAGLGRTAAYGAADLASETFGGPDMVSSDDWVKALKGQAPASSDYLDRAGMEDGALRMGLGLASDIAFDPATYAGFGAFTKLGKLGKILTAADDVTAMGLKGLGKGIGKVTKTPLAAVKKKMGDVGIKIGSTASGLNESALKSFMKDPDKAMNVHNMGGSVYANEKIGNLWSRVQKAKKKMGTMLTEEIRESGKMVDISNVKGRLDKNITNLYDQGNLLPSEIKYLDDLKGLKDELFTTQNPISGEITDIGHMVDAGEASRIKDAISGIQDITKAPEMMGKAIDKRKLSTVRGLGAEMSKSIDNAIPEGSLIKEGYSDILTDEKFIAEKLKNRKNMDPRFDKDAFDEKGFNALSKLDTVHKNKNFNKLKKFDDEYGTTLLEDADSLKAAKQLIEPSLLPVSGNNVVSTGRIALSAAVGANTIGRLPMFDTRSGAAVGMLAGNLLSSPAAIKKMAIGATKADKVLTNTPGSVYKRLGINAFDNRDE